MKYYKIIAIVLVSYLMLGCKKVGAGTVTVLPAPTNLLVTANVSTDGSGTVGFTASANNATNYTFEFGTGETKTTATGLINYQYLLSGTHVYVVTVTATNNDGKAISKSVEVSVTVQNSSNTPFWAEEFNVDGAPDATKWKYDIGTGDGGWGNQELQYYTNRAENASVSNGVLKITAKKESYGGKNYTSARLLSQTKFAFKYGRVEIRAKIPAGVGTWPALWMLGNNINTVGWPSCGEIDIMEHRGSELNKIFGTLHYPGRSGGNADGNTKVISNATTEFHIYTLDWTASAIKIYVDNALIHSVTNTNNIPFNQDFFFILNVAMGGNFAGTVDGAFSAATMEVDYIRIYK